MTKAKTVREILENLISHHEAYKRGDLLGGTHPVDQSLSEFRTLSLERIKGEKKVCTCSHVTYKCGECTCGASDYNSALTRVEEIVKEMIR